MNPYPTIASAHRAVLVLVAIALSGGHGIADPGPVAAQPPAPPASAPALTPALTPDRHAAAAEVLRRCIRQLALGDAFDAKVRQRVWVGGREVVGVGTYEQAGHATSQFNLQVTMHDGDGKHSLQQISDGRLTWTRRQIGETVTLRRVDVGRLDQWSVQPGASTRIGGDGRTSAAVPLRPSATIGAWAEMLDQIIRDHDLTLAGGTLDGRQVWIVTGQLRSEVLQSRRAATGGTLPELMPATVVLAIAKSNEVETGFGAGLPIRIEFRAPEVITAESPGVAPASRLGAIISLFELYSVRAIHPPPIERFRFDHQDAEVNFINDTDRYLLRHNIELTERQTRSLRR